MENKKVAVDIKVCRGGFLSPCSWYLNGKQLYGNGYDTNREKFFMKILKESIRGPLLESVAKNNYYLNATLFLNKREFDFIRNVEKNRILADERYFKVEEELRKKEMIIARQDGGTTVVKGENFRVEECSWMIGDGTATQESSNSFDSRDESLRLRERSSGPWTISVREFTAIVSSGCYYGSEVSIKNKDNDETLIISDGFYRDGFDADKDDPRYRIKNIFIYDFNEKEIFFTILTAHERKSHYYYKASLIAS